MTLKRAAKQVRPALRQLALRLVVDSEHYTEVVERGIRAAKTSVWIATANLKDVHVAGKLGTRARARSRYVSLFEELVAKANAGLDLRILCSSEPSRALRGKLAVDGSKWILRCPRLHAKIIAIDGELLYLGSANFTGAGIGAKSENRRNFETGIVTDCPLLLDVMQSYFDDIWTGKRCKQCHLYAQCASPLSDVTKSSSVRTIAGSHSSQNRSPESSGKRSTVTASTVRKTAATRHRVSKQNDSSLQPLAKKRAVGSKVRKKLK